MPIAAILTIISALAPYIPEAVGDIGNFINRINGGESLADLIAEFEAKRDDLKDLPFGQ